MLKLASLSVFVCLSSLTGFYAAYVPQLAAAPGAESLNNDAPATSSYETELLAAPVISSGKLAGFFFLRMVYDVDASQERKMRAPLSLIVSDSFYGHLFLQPPDVLMSEPFDIDPLMNGLLTSANTLAGRPLVKGIRLLQVDYFTGAEVRKQSVERRRALKAGDENKPAPADHGAPAAH